MRHGQRPVLTQRAQDRLDALDQQFLGDIFDHAQQQAERERVDDISARHIDDAYHALVSTSQRPSRWNNLIDVVGGAILGVMGTDVWAKYNTPTFELRSVALQSLIMVLTVIIIGLIHRP